MINKMKFIYEESDSYGNNNKAYYNATNIYKVYKYVLYKYSEIDIKIMLSEIRINSTYMVKKCLENKNHDDLSLFVFDIVKNLPFIQMCKNRYNLSLEKIIHKYNFDDDIVDYIKKSDTNTKEIVENIYILEELYKIDRKFFIDSIGLNDCENIFKYLYTPGEGIQKNLSAKEWEFRNITEYSNHDFIIIG